MTGRAAEQNSNRVNESIVCDVCGKFDAVEFGDRKICPDCYEGCGSCCSGEFGREEQEIQG
jgi:hypothetical protein